MMVLAHCPLCQNRTAQLLEWHSRVPEHHTRHWCQTCKGHWDEYDPEDGIFVRAASLEPAEASATST